MSDPCSKRTEVGPAHPSAQTVPFHAALGMDTSLPAGERAGSRYQVLRSHARGGLGEVFLARDQELQRDVAVKEMQASQAENPVSRDRFLAGG